MTRSIFKSCLAICVGSFFFYSPAQAETVRYGLASFPPGGGNPFTSPARTSWYTWRAMFDTLTQLGPKAAPVPALAVAWTNTAPTTWVVKLRPDTMFSNGEPFNAAAVIATVTYLLSPAAIQESISREVENIAGVRALDDLTLEFTTKRADPMFARQLTTLAIVPPAYWAKVGRDGFTRTPIGTGPYVVEKWDKARITLKANTTSWRAPKAANAELIALPETSTRIQALLSRRVDIASEIGPEDIDVLKAEGFNVYQRPASSVEIIALNNIAESPLKDVRVRQALNYAVDRQAIADTIMHGLVPPASQTTPRSNPEYDASLSAYPYDPAKAKALLKEAGYEKGFTFVFEMSSGTTGSHYNSMFQKVADDLSKVGVTMEIRPIPWAQFVRGVQQGEWKGQAFGFEYETLPTGETLRPFRLHSCTWSHPWYCDSALTPVIAEAQRTFDPAKRLELVHKVLRGYRDQAAALILVEPLGLDGLSPNVQGYDQLNGIIPYQNVTVQK
ncbi:MAG: ABC transporter substrate-binding protein [Rhodospirillaceae bacterium]|nr:ABC transporter substrate-binding protein [Rhodospirillaceae bacterium]